MRRTIIITGLVATMILGACSKTVPTRPTLAAKPSSVAPAEVEPASAATTAACVSSGSTAGKSAKASGGTMLLRAVRVAGHGCTDRVVFEFGQRAGTNGTPGYRLEYRNGPFTEDASGIPVTVDGSAFLVLRMEPASGADLTGATPSPTYSGSRDIKPGDATHVRELKESGDFEDMMSWIVGLDTKRPFTTSVLREGSTIRLVIDIS